MRPDMSAADYRVIGGIAEGGMAEIMLAQQRGLDGFLRAVALKRMRPELAVRDEHRAMFAHECRVMGGLHHPNIVGTFDCVALDGQPTLVMEYLAGAPLSAFASGGRARELPPAVVAHVIAEVAAALHHAHTQTDPGGRGRGLVHRDVSPQNIFITNEGRVVLLDFGIAWTHDKDTRTRTGSVKGKVAYMSPEQCQAGLVDARTDVFALGVVAHELITGGRLYTRSSDLDTMNAIVDRPAPEPARVDEDLPDGLAAVILRALARDPSERYATAHELREALRPFAAACAAPADALLAGYMTRRYPEAVAAQGELRAQLRCEGPPPAEDLCLRAGLMPVARSALPQMAEFKVTTTAPALSETVAARPMAITAAAARGPGPAAPPWRRSVALGLVAAALCLGAWAWWRAPAELHATRQPEALATEEARAATAGVLAVPAGPTGPAARAHEPAERRPSPTPEPPTARAVTLLSSPPGATVAFPDLPDQASVTTPATVHLPRSERGTELRFERAGHRPVTRRVDLTDEDPLTLDVQLSPRRAAGAGASSGTEPSTAPTPERAPAAFPRFQ